MQPPKWQGLFNIETRNWMLLQGQGWLNLKKMKKNRLLSEDLHGLSGLGLTDPYQTYKPLEMFESFVPTSYQFKKVINAGDVGTIGIIPYVFQATKLNGRKNEVPIPSSGFSVQ